MTTPSSAVWTLDQFLDWDSRQPGRNEYFDGVIVAMTSGTLRHNATVSRVANELESALDGTPCRVFRENVRLATATSVRYPDVLVVCSPVDLDTDRVSDADLIVEVLSPSTEPIDRTDKAREYRTLANLRGYLIVDVSGACVEAYVRDGLDTPWVRTTTAFEFEVHGRRVSFVRESPGTG